MKTKTLIRVLAKPATLTLKRLIRCLQLVNLRLRGLEAEKVQIHGRLRLKVSSGSRIALAPGVVLNSKWTRNTLDGNAIMTIRTLDSKAEITIGANTGISSSTISAQKRISIGQGVLIGSGCLITDTDHHLVDVDVIQRRNAGLPPLQNAKEVSIADNVFIGARAIILKGSVIGYGSVIGAGSVVSGVIPEYSVAAGNPCRVIRKLSIR